MLSIIISTALSITLGHFSFSQQTLTQKVDQIISESLDKSKNMVSFSAKNRSFQASYKQIEALVNGSILKTEITEDDLTRAGVHQIVALSLTELIPNKTDQGYTPESCTTALSTASKSQSDATKKEPALIQLRERVQKFIRSECGLN